MFTLPVPEDQVLQQIEIEEDIPLSVRKASAAIEAEKEKYVILGIMHAICQRYSSLWI